MTMPLHGHLGGFAQYMQEHGSLNGAWLYVLDKEGAERLCHVVSSDDPRRVRVGAKILAHFEGLGIDDESIPQDSDRIKCILTNDEHAERLRKEFEQFDKDKNGELSFDELKGILRYLVPKRWSERQMQVMFRRLDLNSDGSVDLDEFISWVMNGKGVPAKKQRPEGDTDATPGGIGAATGGASEADWQKACLESHNKLRAKHGSSALSWSSECYDLAKKQADACQAQKQLCHGNLDGPSGKHGQNVYWCSRPGSTAMQATQSWYDEISDPGYDFATPGFKSGTGHFTAVVWAATTQVGMATSADGRFIVANYFPAGNVMPASNFQTNVQPPK
eukprot:TRINITY_DN22012_c0_g1_i2.p1 TRINITY_DN22012_c0_g1~~TRINITY_DN22012_c0_g1_i2.p1  ORF type:complete len:333 (-),score=71.41 TRINITY_DN22012_c0_g1_i2:250-1248(-)